MITVKQSPTKKLVITSISQQSQFRMISKKRKKKADERIKFAAHQSSKNNKIQYHSSLRPLHYIKKFKKRKKKHLLHETFHVEP